MTQVPAAKNFRYRLKLCGAAALMLLCTACGDHPPKDDGDDTDPPPPPTPAITVFAGDASTAGVADGSGTAARFNAPQGLAIDSGGNLYVADSGNYVIRKITPAGVVTTIAGVAGSSSHADGNASNARFVNPSALAVNGSGTVFVTDNLRIRSISAAGQVGTQATIPVGDNVDGRSMAAVNPGAIAVDNNGNLFVTNNYGTRRIAINNSTLMLEGQNTVDDLFGTRTQDRRGVAVDSSNTVYLFDLEREISRWNPNGLIGAQGLVTIAGAPNARGAVNGTGNAARFEQVVALTVDPQGNLYAADALNNLVRKITPAGVVTTVAGTTRATTLQTGDLPGSFANMAGIVTDGKGSLYVTSGHAVIKIRLP